MSAQLLNLTLLDMADCLALFCLFKPYRDSHLGAGAYSCLLSFRIGRAGCLGQATDTRLLTL